MTSKAAGAPHPVHLSQTPLQRRTDKPPSRPCRVPPPRGHRTLPNTAHRTQTQNTTHNTHTTAYLENVGEGDLCRPISLESVDADVAVGSHVGVVDLRQEEPAGRRVREVVAQDELDVERPPIVRRPDCLEGKYIYIEKGCLLVKNKVVNRECVSI